LTPIHQIKYMGTLLSKELRLVHFGHL